MHPSPLLHKQGLGGEPLANYQFGFGITACDHTSPRGDPGDEDGKMGDRNPRDSLAGTCYAAYRATITKVKSLLKPPPRKPQPTSNMGIYQYVSKTPFHFDSQTLTHNHRSEFSRDHHLSLPHFPYFPSHRVLSCHSSSNIHLSPPHHPFLPSPIHHTPILAKQCEKKQ